MKFEVFEATEILRQTPATLETMLRGLSREWTIFSPAKDEWSAFDVIGHLIHGEKTDWIPRTKLILQRGPNVVFEEFDRFAQFAESNGKTLGNLLDEFAVVRRGNLETLHSLNLNPEDLIRRGVHPSLGEVTLKQLLATWVVHDLTHIRQVANILAKRYAEDVGPWKAYLSILK